MNATVKDVMSTHVIAVNRDAPFKTMAVMLREQRVSAFPVIDDERKVVGVISEADLLVKEAQSADGPTRRLRSRMRAKADGVTAADLMSTPPVTIGPDELASLAARLMSLRHVKRLPVTDGSGRLVGIVTRSDVLAVYDRTDDEIRREITQDVILGKCLCDPARFTVTVEDGIVTIGGAPETWTVGSDIIDAIRRVDGVVTVYDRLNAKTFLCRPPARP